MSKISPSKYNKKKQRKASKKLLKGIEIFLKNRKAKSDI